MKKTISVLTLLLFIAALLIGVTNCKKSNPTFELSTLVAGAINLNAATPPSNVPATSSFEADFNLDVDAATVSNAVITLVRDYDAAAINLTLTVAGKKITIVPDEDLGNGALYVLNFLAGIKATDGQMLVAFNRSFSTEGQFVPAGVIAYWNFENNPNDQVGSYNPDPSDIIDVTYEISYDTAAGMAATFNGTTTLIEIPNGDVLMNTDKFTLSFWVMTNSADKTSGDFTMGLAGVSGFQFEIANDYSWCKLAAQYELTDGTTAGQDLYFHADGDVSYPGHTYCRDLTASGGLPPVIKDKWASVVCTFDGSTRIGTMYINGLIMKQQNFNLYPSDNPIRNGIALKYAGNAAPGNHLAFGFIQGRNNRTILDSWADYADPNNNHFKGQLDDIRIFHKALTPTEIDLMYQSEKP